MKVKKFEFIETLICDARWCDVNKDTTSDQRLAKVEELWIRYNNVCESEPVYHGINGMLMYVTCTIYSDY